MPPLAKIWAALLAVAIAAYAVYAVVRTNKNNAPAEGAPKLITLSPETQPLDDLRELKFVERSGANFRWPALDGKIWIANSFFSTCTRECTALSHSVAALHRFHPEVRFLSLTCDPDTDTPARLREYASQFAADPDRWFFVTGDMPDLAHAGQILFGEPLKRHGHGQYVALVGPDGRRIGAYDVLSQQGFMDLQKAIADLQRPPIRAPEPT